VYIFVFPIFLSWICKFKHLKLNFLFFKFVIKKNY
jgi:hypothetical protein